MSELGGNVNSHVSSSGKRLERRVIMVVGWEGDGAIASDKISAHNVTFITRWSEDGRAFGHVPDWQLEFLPGGDNKEIRDEPYTL